ncbi:MAG: hypothetical protein GXP08_05905 [Gammaproteobacteria bacterium]|nr:hypothetical protein [Gammaproteobacteria bacterium]
MGAHPSVNDQKRASSTRIHPPTVGDHPRASTTGTGMVVCLSQKSKQNQRQFESLLNI